MRMKNTNPLAAFVTCAYHLILNSVSNYGTLIRPPFWRLGRAWGPKMLPIEMPPPTFLIDFCGHHRPILHRLATVYNAVNRRQTAITIKEAAYAVASAT